MLIAIYNFCEKQIETLCVEIKKFLPNEIFDKTCPESEALKSYRKLLTSNVGFNFSRIDAQWQYLQVVKLIRNALCHSEGEIDENKKRVARKIRLFCQKHKNIRLSNNRLIIDIGFIGEVVSEITLLFRALFEEVHSFIQRYDAVHGRFEILLPPGASKTPL